MIPRENCKDRFVYRISSRNLSFGVFQKEGNGFIGIRTKFGSRYLFTEYHWDNGPPHGTVTPLEELMALPEDIEAKDNLGSMCEVCEKDVKFDMSRPPNERWYHVKPSECPDFNVRPLTRHNDKLFKFMEGVEGKVLTSVWVGYHNGDPTAVSDTKEGITHCDNVEEYVLAEELEALEYLVYNSVKRGFSFGVEAVGDGPGYKWVTLRSDVKLKFTTYVEAAGFMGRVGNKPGHN